jgi:integrase/recombinase XerC
MLKEFYIEYLTYEKRFSQHTVTAYKTDLEDFIHFLQTQTTISEPQSANHTHVRAWLIHLVNEGNSNRSVNRKISTLRSFYKYLMRTGSVQVNPMLKVVAPRTEKTLPEFVPVNNMLKLLNESELKKDYTQHRDFIILTLLYATGIRRNELVQLSTQDVDLMNNTIKVTGKRNKQRIIPLAGDLVLEIKKYIEKREEFILEQDAKAKNNLPALFVTNKLKPIYPELVYRVVHNYLSKVASNNKLSPHILRHSFATHMLDNGADLNAIKEILGHANLSATQVYTHNTIEKLKQIYKQAHPRA